LFGVGFWRVTVDIAKHLSTPQNLKTKNYSGRDGQSYTKIRKKKVLVIGETLA
jgi:hypothetical protein